MKGNRYGRLIVLGRHGCPDNLIKKWLCICDCGNTATVTTGHLKTSHTRSCGCLVMESRTKHNQHNSPTYISWAGMLRRCRRDDPNYTQRGIGVCIQWSDFETFVTDMGERPSLKHEIDRVDNDGDYEPGNCRWVSHKTNTRNTRKSKWWFVDGVKYESKSQAAEAFGVNPRTICSWCNGVMDRGKFRQPKPNCWSELKY